MSVVKSFPAKGTYYFILTPNTKNAYKFTFNYIEV